MKIQINQRDMFHISLCNLCTKSCWGIDESLVVVTTGTPQSNPVPTIKISCEDSVGESVKEVVAGNIGLTP